MTSEIYLVAEALPGAVFIMPCPAGDLALAMRDYRAAGVERVVSMLTEDEARQLQLEEEARYCRDAGMAFETFGIADFGVPDVARFDPFLHALAARVAGRARVAVHCRAGIGRSGLVVSGLLMALGQTAGVAVDQVSRARGVSVPETVEQRQFLDALELRLQGKRGQALV